MDSDINRIIGLIMNHKEEEAERLIDYHVKRNGFNINTRIKSNIAWTADSCLLILSVQYQCYFLLEYLLSIGADPNHVTFHTYNTPLWYAAQNIDVPMIQILLRHGAKKEQAYHSILKYYLNNVSKLECHSEEIKEIIELLKVDSKAKQNKNVEYETRQQCDCISYWDEDCEERKYLKQDDGLDYEKYYAEYDHIYSYVKNYRDLLY